MSRKADLTGVASVLGALRLRAEGRHAELRRRIAALEARRAALLLPPDDADPFARALWDRWADAALRAVARDRALAEADRIEAADELRRVIAREIALDTLMEEEEAARTQRQARRAEEGGDHMS
ncbi:hypothetical protein [Pontivivens ytuae]|uniref:Uncharacterized protein n=1 Tax=Pontivivens ytuae TaxID=2789856 RepID=A0A7S9QBP0_9RHOB|nr:hypothetical protein [Pontivivens ytuae]QPH53093.1 hypothetical protein I0K15_14975 [Pontivivens ytuae]